MSDKPRNASVEMTLVQWVETLPPGHVARNELAYLREGLEFCQAQLARLPGSGDSAKDTVDAVLRRQLDTESALASLVHLASQCRGELDDEFGSFPEGLDAAIETAEKILAARPSALGGTAHGVSR